MNFRTMQSSAVFCVLAVALVVGGCASTSRAPDIERTGFMGADYDLLRAGPDRGAQLAYLRPGVNWAAYRNVLLDPVTVWTGKESTGKGISAQDAQTLVNYFYSVIHGALEKEGFASFA